MSITSLTDQNFVSMNGGRIMGLNLPGYKGLSFVMFKTDKCPHCVNFIPRLINVAKQEQRVRFFVASEITTAELWGHLKLQILRLRMCLILSFMLALIQRQHIKVHIWREMF